MQSRALSSCFLFIVFWNVFSSLLFFSLEVAELEVVDFVPLKVTMVSPFSASVKVVYSEWTIMVLCRFPSTRERPQWITFSRIGNLGDKINP